MRKKLQILLMSAHGFWKKHRLKAFITLVLLLLPIASFLLFYFGKVYPGVSVAGIYLGGKTQDQAIETLSHTINTPTELVLTSSIGAIDQEFSIKLTNTGFSIDYAASAERAYKLGRSGNPVHDLSSIIKLLISGHSSGLSIQLNEDALAQQLEEISSSLNLQPVQPAATLSEQGITITSGEPGVSVDTDLLRALIGRHLALASPGALLIPTSTIDPSLSASEAEKFRMRAENLIDKRLTATFEDHLFVYKNEDLFSLLNPKDDEAYSRDNLSEEILVISEVVNRDPQNAKFEFTGGRVNEFAPGKDSLAVKIKDLKNEFEKHLTELETGDLATLSFEIPVTKTSPEVATEDVNNLGIRELIGRGTSKFRGSISSRVFNIALAASRLNGTLVAPGEVLSFNEALGDVSKFTGYKEAYIIKDGATVLGDGGGVCQVSTTLFRAVLDTGLPIVERRAHSYRVGYYEQDAKPGLDATVYSPTTDLKIENDTPAHILIQAFADTVNSTLTFEVYGTKDGRVAGISAISVSNLVEPPEDLYTDDPSLPAGTIKQIDFKAWGAKSRFDYTVEKDGEVTYTKTFYSNFRPWQAKFLRGTGAVN